MLISISFSFYIFNELTCYSCYTCYNRLLFPITATRGSQSARATFDSNLTGCSRVITHRLFDVIHTNILKICRADNVVQKQSCLPDYYNPFSIVN